MSFLDKAKAAAEKVAAEASKGAAQVQDKVQARKPRRRQTTWRPSSDT